jgi:outer membrane immunogenic protein
MGFNLQLDQTIFGVEGDLNWEKIVGNANCPFAGSTCTTGSNYLGTVRGRFGYAWDRLMGYLTGGAAFGDIQQSFSPGIGINEGTTSNRVGWTIGVGVEYALWQGWSAKVEYLHVDLGDFVCGVACSGVATNNLHTTLTEELVRGGINYRF